MTNCELYCMYFIIKEIICGTRHSSRCLFVFALYLSVVFAHFFEHKLPFSSPSHASLTVGVRESDSVCVCVWVVLLFLPRTHERNRYGRCMNTCFVFF